MAIVEHHNECACHATNRFCDVNIYENDSYYNSISIEMNRLNVLNLFLVEIFLASMSENIYRFFCPQLQMFELSIIKMYAII